MSDVVSTNPPPGDNTSENVTIIVPVVLGSVILLLVIALAASACLFLKKRRKLCFREVFEDQDQKRILLVRDDHGRGKPWRVKKKPLKSSKPKAKKRRKSRGAKYHSLGRAPQRFKTDPFANVVMENPLGDDFELEEDWSNPLFDSEKAALSDAAVCIQSWYRMIR